MKIINTHLSRRLWLTTILMSTLLLGCSNENDKPAPVPEPPLVTTPTVTSMIPVNMATQVLIGTNISAQFSEAMDASSINLQSVVLRAGTQIVAGSVNLDAANNTAFFTPTTALTSSTDYTMTVTTGASSAAGQALASDFVWRFTTDMATDTQAPTVSATAPADAATDIALDTSISVNFSEAIDPASVNDTSFTLTDGTTQVTGVVTSAGATATFTPDADLPPSTLYTATLTTAIVDLSTSPNALENDYVWSFTTGLSIPKVTLTHPLDSEVNVAINRTLVATFSEPMDALTLDNVSFTLSAPNAVAVAGTVSVDLDTHSATFQPTTVLSADTVYSATITTAAMSATGMALAKDHSWSFSTVATPDVTAPTVMATMPLDNALDFPLNRNLVVEFSEALAPSSINGASFIVTNGVTQVAGTLVYGGTSITFNPTENLAANTLYTARLTTAITDLASPANPLASDYIWRFTTSAAAAKGPAAVNLKTAGNFVILTKTGTTNVHTSAITGNMGASPITAAAMDNVFCHEITGIIYGSNAAYTGSGDINCFAGAAPDNTLVATAVLDMTTAYNDAAGRTSPNFTELYAGDISGKTLVPGLYKWSTGVLISTDVTLNGAVNDVWIFQVSGDVTQANASSIILAGGAQAKNIFWQVEGGAGVTLGTTAHFEGVILAQKAIVVNTGASVNGRLFAHTAVTLDQNTVTQPAP